MKVILAKKRKGSEKIMTLSKAIGRVLKRKRQALNMSQKQLSQNAAQILLEDCNYKCNIPAILINTYEGLADAIGIIIHDYERLCVDRNLDEVAAIAQALGTTLIDVLKEAELLVAQLEPGSEKKSDSE